MSRADVTPMSQIALAYQRGISLFWTAVLMLALAFGLFAVLVTFSGAGDPVGIAWTYLKGSKIGKSVQQLPQLKQLQQAQPAQPKTAGSIPSDASEIRKCMINGSIVYSNVDCAPENKTTRKLNLQNSQGFEPPKPASASAP